MASTILPLLGKSALITRSSLLVRGENANGEKARGAHDPPKGAGSSITLVTMAALFMLTAALACLTFVTSVIVTSVIARYVLAAFCAESSFRARKVFPKVGSLK